MLLLAPGVALAGGPVYILLPCQERLYYAEAFSPLPGRCFRMVAHHGEAGPTHCPEPVAWRGS